MEELRDIKGLVEVSAWPLGIAWWILLIVILAIIFLSLRALHRNYLYKKSWQYRSLKNLHKLELLLNNRQDKTNVDLKIIVNNLSAEIRRIAMSATKRETCAGLVGMQWLEWLKIHDPQNYDWLSNGQLLINYQYMPATDRCDKDDLRALINAAKKWVSK